MASIVSKYITDSLEETMKSYTSTEEYQNEQAEINKKIDAIRSSLPEAQKVDLNDLLNMIDNANGKMVEKAYQIGVAQGVCFRDETIRR